MNDLIFNLRIWKIHFQIQRKWKISFIFRWFDLWFGLYIDQKNESYYLFPVPTLGLKSEGVWMRWNNHYSFKNDPFVWLFNYGDKYYPMRNYNHGGHDDAK
jgi:hypothetical protein